LIELIFSQFLSFLKVSLISRVDIFLCYKLFYEVVIADVIFCAIKGFSAFDGFVLVIGFDVSF
jgi:hypothetical protein